MKYDANFNGLVRGWIACAVVLKKHNQNGRPTWHCGWQKPEMLRKMSILISSVLCKRQPRGTKPLQDWSSQENMNARAGMAKCQMDVVVCQLSTMSWMQQ